jgi:hypothetical protein
MTHEELKAIVAAKMNNPNENAADILYVIRAAISEPTNAMLYAAKWDAVTYFNGDIWKAMLAASPLGEKSK